MLRIAIVDDDARFQGQLEDFISRYFQHEAEQFCVQCYGNGVAFLSDYQSNFDLVIIDIMMPLMNGIEVARKLREQDQNVLLMFITETADFAIRGYEVSAVDYILKPLSYEADFKFKFERAVRRAKALQLHKELLLKDDRGRLVKLPADDLIYVEKDRDNALYYTTQGVFSQRIPIFKVEESLRGEASFAVVNSGCLVNMAFIDNISGSVIELFGGEKLVLSRSRKKAFYEKFFDHIGQ